MSLRLFRDGGGAGGGPLFEDTVLPLFCGLIVSSLPGGTPGGGGGGLIRPSPFPGLSLAPIRAPLAFRCSI